MLNFQAINSLNGLPFLHYFPHSQNNLRTLPQFQYLKKTRTDPLSQILYANNDALKLLVVLDDSQHAFIGTQQNLQFFQAT